MPRLPFGRILLITPLAFLSAAASALDISLESTSETATFTDLGKGEFSLCADQDTFVVQSTNPQIAPFTDACFGLTYVAGKPEAILSYKDDTKMNTLSLKLDVASYKTANGVVTVTGTWSYTSGQGDYDDCVAADSKGRYTFTWNMTTGATDLDLDGILASRSKVPSGSAANLSALALGAPILLRRRRR